MPRYTEVNIADILIEDRAREDLGDLSDIKESMSGFAGQIQSVALEELEQPREDGKKYRLLAGERRIRSAMDLKKETIGAGIYDPLDSFERAFIELSENTARKSFTWQEEVAFRKRVHDLHIAKHGKKTGPRAGTGWSQTDTAKVIGSIDHASISRDLALAEAVETIPELKQCKSRNEAANLLAKLREQEITRELRKRAEKRASAASPSGGVEGSRKFLMSQYHLGDSIAWLAEQPDGSADLVEIDPDYNIDFGNQRVFNNSAKERATAAATATYVEFKGSTAEYQTYLNLLCSEAYRVLKPDGWCLLWFAMDPWFETAFTALQTVGFQAKRLPAMWCKCLDGSEMRHTAAPEFYLGHGYEAFFYARKGGAAINRRARIDVFHYPAPRGERTHPAEKPVELMEDIYNTFARPNARIVIPFAGSGNGIIAAANQYMIASGCDLSEEFRNRFIVRMSEWTPKLSTAKSS